MRLQPTDPPCQTHADLVRMLVPLTRLERSGTTLPVCSVGFHGTLGSHSPDQTSEGQALVLFGVFFFYFNKIFSRTSK